MELFHAAKQWCERPADERFWTLEEMLKVTNGYAKSAQESLVKRMDLRTEAADGEVKLTGKAGVMARLTHWSFGQLASLISAPANYLRSLPATLAVQNLNCGLAKLGEEDGTANLLFHKNGDMLLRSLLSDKYTRIWNWEVVERLEKLGNDGWRVPPARPAFKGQPGTRPATEQDVLESAKRLGDIGIKVGDPIAPAGLYASDHDMFAFLVDESRPIDSGSGKPMYRGFFTWNSEVGAKSFGIMTFLYDAVCGNHIVWGAENVKEVRIKHIGTADEQAFQKLSVELVRYSKAAAGDVEMMIRRARTKEIAMTKDDVLNKLYDLNVGSKKLIEHAYDVAAENEKVNGAPNTVWGMVSGLTRVSQEEGSAEDRAWVDRSAGKLLQVVEF